MTKVNSTAQAEAARAQETAAAHARLLRLAKEQGVKPFDAEEWRAELETDQTPAEVRREIDDFLAQLRAWRDTPSGRSAE